MIDTIFTVFWSQGAHPLTKSYKILQNDHASYILPQSQTKLPENAISPTISYFFLFSWVKIYFYKYFLGPWSRKIVTSLIYLILGTSQWSVPLFPWVKMSWSFFVLLLEALLCTTILNSKFSTACGWSPLYLSSHLTNTLPLVMLDYQWWHIWSTYWRNVTANRIQAHGFPNFWPLRS